MTGQLYTKVGGTWKPMDVVGATVTLLEVNGPASGSFVVPPGVTSLNLLIVAGGGGGSAMEFCGDAHSGGGGGAGGFYSMPVSVVPGETLLYNIGPGGVGGTYGGWCLPPYHGPGGDGTDSTISGSFGTYTPTHGIGGTCSFWCYPCPGIGGAGGIPGGVAGTNGVIYSAGPQPGGNNGTGYGYGGYGGAGAGQAGGNGFLRLSYTASPANIYVKVGGTWRVVTHGFVKVGGTWHPTYK